LLGAERVRMNDGVPFGDDVLGNGKSRHTRKNTTVPKNLLMRIFAIENPFERRLPVLGGGRVEILLRKASALNKE
jgi:hypothetical protein